MTESAIDSRLCRYDRQLLRDARIQESVRRSGYAVLPQSVRPEVVLALRSVVADCVERPGPSFGDECLSVGRIGDPSLMERPRTPHHFLGERPRHRISLTQSDFIDVCDFVVASAR